MRLRRKIGPEVIETRRGFGYVLAGGGARRRDRLRVRLLLGAAVAIFVGACSGVDR